MTTAIPFAGLAPDSRARRGFGELSRFDVLAALDVGSALRNAGAGEATTAELAGVLLDAINAYEHDQRPACVLLRLFVTRRLRELPLELQASVRRRALMSEPSADPLCLELVAARGIEPEWNDASHSPADAAVVLEGAVAPFADELGRQLRFGDSAAPPASSFYIAEAAEHPAVSAAAFVKAYGVRTVFGFATTAWPGETLVLVCFARTLLERATVRAFETVALYLEAAWLETQAARLTLQHANPDRLRADVLGEIVTLHEIRLRDAVLDFAARLGRERERGQQSVDASARQAETHNAELRRTQRAMLNVIEDLREARGALESQVANRTRELAFANKQLVPRPVSNDAFAAALANAPHLRGSGRFRATLPRGGDAPRRLRSCSSFAS